MERTYTTPLLDKLGIRPGSRVVLVRIDDPDIRVLLATRTHDVLEAAPGGVGGDSATIGGALNRLDAAPLTEVDVVLLGADTIDELDALAAWRLRIRPNAAIWIVSRKGKSATIRDVDVIAAARSAGLVDNKVASFSATHTALRLVIPVAGRPR